MTNLENGCDDQEQGTEPNCDQNTDGELGGVITLKVALGGVDKVTSTLATADMLTIGDDWNDTVAPVIMQPNETREITMHWATDEDSYGNEIQSDSLTFDSVFQLIQIINGPSPANR